MTEEQPTVPQESEEQPGVSFSTAHEHFYLDGGLNENNLLDVYCACGHGMQVSPLELEIQDGKLIKRIIE